MPSATPRASRRSSRQTRAVTQATLSFTYSPTGSAYLMVSLYTLISGSKSRGEPKLKHSAPKPRRAAFSKVDGLPHATHSGGGGLVLGFGRPLRSGGGEELRAVGLAGLPPHGRGAPPRPSATRARV